MSVAALVGAAAVAGLLGSPHCVAMCGAACGGIGGGHRDRAFLFQAGRMTGYAALGAIGALLGGGIQVLAARLPLLTPFWAMFHVAVVVVGAGLAWLGTQPAWLERSGAAIWRTLRGRTLELDALRWPFAAGALWALLPCGLLYSALMLAVLAEGPVAGAAVMLAFAGMSGLALQFGASLLRRLRERHGRWGVRVAGVALIATSSWALLNGVGQQVAALCR